MAHRNDEWLKTAYPKYLSKLVNYLRRFVGDKQVAEDLAHDAFIRVWEAPNFDHTGKAQGYLFTTARRLARDRGQLHSVARTNAEVEVTEMPDEQSAVEQQAMTAEELETISAAIKRLPQRRQRVLLLSAFYGYSGQEIADHLGISRATVHRELARAIESVHIAKGLVETEKARRGTITHQRDADSGT